MTREEEEAAAADAALYRAGERAMRERAAEAAAGAFPDPDAMLRAIYAIPIDPAAEPRHRIAVEPLDDGADLVRDGRRVSLRGGTTWRILAVHGHMRRHGAAWGETYLMGVIDGLGHASATQLADVVEGIRRRREEAEEAPPAALPGGAA